MRSAPTSASTRSSMRETVTSIRAAVLIPIRVVPEVGLVMTMIRRTVGGTHSGQMAFPGGRHDHVRDRSLLDTALRESAEEVGLDAGHVEIIGALPERRTLSSQFVVTPFVARIPEPYSFIPEAHEVARIIDAPLADFRDPSRRVDYEWEYGERIVRVPSVRIEGEIVWGLSLAIIDDLLASRLAPSG